MLEPLKKLLRENEVNAFLREREGVEGFEFVEQVLDYFNASCSVVDREIERIPSEGRVVIAAHQPLGLLEAAALLKLVGQVRRDVRIVANDLLAPFAPLRPLLLPPEAIGSALEDGEAVIVGGWRRLARDARAPLLPVHIGGRNWALFSGLSGFFRRNATLRIRIGRTSRMESGKVIGLRSHTPVAHPEDRLLVRRELQGAQRLGQTHDGKRILLFDAKPDSAVLRELGRLREIAFRQVGEGTGKRRDVDAFDAYYRHVVLWDDAELQIAGAYRIGEASRLVAERGEDGLYTHGLFSYGDGLRSRFAQAIELGRSFVQPRYQGMRALDYLWHGIGAYLLTRPELRYLFGPVSLSAAYPEAARRMLVHFFGRHFGACENLATGRRPFALAAGEALALERLLPGQDYNADLRMLKQQLAAMGVSIPILYKQYAELCEPGGTKFLAFNVDPAFANCVDGLVLVDLQRLKAAKRERYLGAGWRIVEPAAALLKSA
jgi:putative hemolysin